MKERREYLRVGVEFPVRVEFSRGEDFLMEETRLENLSAGGALFPSSYKWAPGDEIVLNISAPGKIAGDLFSFNGQEMVEDVVFKSAAVVLRMQERREEKRESNLVAVKFRGPLRIGVRKGRSSR
jgi:hypothetical protein